MTIEIQSAEQKALEQAPTDQCRDCGQQVELVRSPEGRKRFGRHNDQTGQMCRGWFVEVDDLVSWGFARESRFTAPRQECPHPERWHSSDAEGTEWEVSDLVAAFVTALRPDCVVETGTAWGQTAWTIGTALHWPRGSDMETYGKLYTLEVDPRRCQVARERCQGLPVEVIETSSLDWDPPEPIDFAWFDSHHQLRVSEFRKFHRHMHSRTIVGFHDTGSHQGDLRRQLSALEAEGLMFPIHLPTPRGVTFGEVGFP